MTTSHGVESGQAVQRGLAEAGHSIQAGLKELAKATVEAKRLEIALHLKEAHPENWEVHFAEIIKTVMK